MGSVGLREVWRGYANSGARSEAAAARPVQSSFMRRGSWNSVRALRTVVCFWQGWDWQEPRHWRVREVIPMTSYTLEFALDGAAMSFEWRFDGLAGGGTRLTQHIVLKGENAAAYVAQVQPAFTSLASGMNRIAAAIIQAEAGVQRG